MVSKIIIFVICFLTLPTACDSQPAKVNSNIMPAAAQTQKNPKIWLNRDSMGSLDDPSKLKARLTEMMERRERNGDYIEDTDSTAGLVAPPLLRDGVYLLVAPDVSVGEFKKIYELLDEQCTVFVPRSDALKGSPQDTRPNPFLLAVTVGADAVDLSKIAQFGDFDSKKKYSYDMSIVQSADADDLWFNRILGAIEILANGSYIVNERYETVDRKKPLDDYPPKQRPAKSSLKEEVARLTQAGETGRNNLTIIANASAPYKSLDEILKLAEELKLDFQIKVNPAK